MDSRVSADDSQTNRHVWSNPFVYLILLAALCLLGLIAQPFLPIGSSYWDLSLYYDAAHRIANGQIPSRDFLTPVGPLEYYLFYLVNTLFPASHPLLSTQWSVLVAAFPLFATVILFTEKDSRNVAFLLTLPFVCFALLPLNSAALYPAPGFDGYGVYNRHAALLLYVLASALLFVRHRAVVQIVVGLTLLCLFLTKITGFATGALLTFYAIASGRLRLVDTLVAGICVIAALGAVEIANQSISAYIVNILQLAALNDTSFASRYRAFAGNHLDVILPLLVAAALLFAGRKDEATPAGKQSGFLAGIRSTLNSGAAWLCAMLVASFIFEIQNTGSQEFIYVWPAVLLSLQTLWQQPHRYRAAAMAALVVAGIPIVAGFAQRALHTSGSALTYTRLDAPELGPIGRVTARPVFFARVPATNKLYIEQREAFRTLARQGLAPSDILSAEPDFQLGWLNNTAAAVRAFRALEISTGRQIETVYTLDFTDPFPYLLGKDPIRHVQIGVDTGRTLPYRDERMMRSIAGAEAILVPQCPPTPMREVMAQRLAGALEGRQRIALTPCFDLLLRNARDFATR